MARASSSGPPRAPSSTRRPGSPVAFEVDEVDRDRRSGWSVVIHGIAHEVRSLGRDEITARLLTLPVDPWAGGDKPFLLRIAPLSITGRSITPGPPA